MKLNEEQLDTALMQAASVADAMKGKKPAQPSADETALEIAKMLKQRVRSVAGVEDTLLAEMVSEYIAMKGLRGNPNQLVAQLARDVDFIAFLGMKMDKMEEPSEESVKGAVSYLKGE